MASEQMSDAVPDYEPEDIPARVNHDANTLCVGSRRSALALFQTHHVIAELRKLEPQTEFEVLTMTTKGDAILNQPINKIGTKSLFTGELETALMDGRVDFVVHSLKDMPTQLPEGLVIGCVTSRESPFDVFIAKRDSGITCLADLPEGSVIGTSSTRRIAQLKRKFPHFKFADVRGNLNSRLRKLDEGELYSGLILATAGITRLGWSDRLTQILDEPWCAYAVGQGAMAVECRANDTRVMKLLNKIMERETLISCVTERAFLRKLEGGCSVPVAVKCNLVKSQEVEEDAKLQLEGLVLSNDGSICLKANSEVSFALPDELADSDTTGENDEGDHSALSLEQQQEEMLQSNMDQPAFHVGLAQYKPNELQLSQQRAAAALGQSVAEDLLAQGALPILKNCRVELEAIIEKRARQKRKKLT